MADQQQPGGGEQQPAQPLWPAAYGQAASFKFQHIPPPSESYFSLNDRLIIRMSDPYSHIPPLTIAGRVLRMDGQIIYFREDFQPTTGGFGPFDFSVQVGEGFLLSVSVYTQPSAVTLSSNWVEILRTISVGSTQLIIGPLAAGYLSSNLPIGWPPVNYERPGNGGGVGGRFYGVQPAPGAEAVTMAAAGQKMRVSSVWATLTTSAAVANRVVSFVLIQGPVPVELFRTTASTAQPASTTQLYVGIAGIGAPYQNTVGSQVRNFLPLPIGMVITRNFSIQTATDNLKPGDQWSILSVSGEAWAVDE